jgi:hypothetical protein
MKVRLGYVRQPLGRQLFAVQAVQYLFMEKLLQGLG